MSTRPARPVAAGAFPRRSLLVAAGALPLLGALAACTDPPPGADAVTPQQEDRLAGQVAVQTELVAAVDAVLAAAPDLAAAVPAVLDQCRDQLRRLQEAAPSVTGSPTTTSGSGTASPAPAAPVADPRAELRTRLTTAADSHAAACLDFTGARAALLGSIAAGLRGQLVVLA
ncbi:hypothetical protein [Klenkia taihuensis]|uniref:Uncharacterized protein n=1 Tax=Klenkia taihuensis TaxID=1225127 RepID=A0A1I1KWB3_9ACTN|nr:hypothetical protein [Klenkia taihuensis]GHE10036.1 hypothetical protein GCM10011381_17320 [Klenkia taihuensis]SFC65084.1 hypothetical protein SAMN05661030_1552 [Klenkia taihuensis]